MKKHPTNQDGYETALSHFYIGGGRNGAMAEMARALDVTRAAVSLWRKTGVPIKYVPALKKITGLRGRDILPELVDLLD
jgi:hypothetical protein